MARYYDEAAKKAIYKWRDKNREKYNRYQKNLMRKRRKR